MTSRVLRQLQMNNAIITNNGKKYDYKNRLFSYPYPHLC